MRYGRIGPRHLLPENHDSRDLTYTKKGCGVIFREKSGTSSQNSELKRGGKGNDKHQAVCLKE